MPSSPFLTDAELEEAGTYGCKGPCEHIDCKLSKHVAWRERGFYWDDRKKFFSRFESVIKSVEEA
jgi:hypothetical protein